MPTPTINEVIEDLKDRIKNKEIKTRDELKKILEQLNPSDILEVLKGIQKPIRDAKFIEFPKDLARLLPSKTDFNEIYNALKEEWIKEPIQDLAAFNRLFELFQYKDRVACIPKLWNGDTPLILKSKDLSSILIMMSDDQQIDFFENHKDDTTFKNLMVNLIKSMDDFAQILDVIPLALYPTFCNIMEDFSEKVTVLDWIDATETKPVDSKATSAEKMSKFFEALKRFSQEIQNLDDLVALAKLPKVVKKIVKEKGTMLIEEACAPNDFRKFMNVIHSMALQDYERKNLVEHLSIGQHAAKWMNSIEDIITILPVLSTGEFEKTCEILKKTKSLSMMIQSTEDLQRIEEALVKAKRIDLKSFFYKILIQEWAEKGIEDNEFKRGLSLLKVQEQVLLCSQLFPNATFEEFKKVCRVISVEARQKFFGNFLTRRVLTSWFNSENWKVNFINYFNEGLDLMKNSEEVAIFSNACRVFLQSKVTKLDDTHFFLNFQSEDAAKFFTEKLDFHILLEWQKKLVQANRQWNMLSKSEQLQRDPPESKFPGGPPLTGTSSPVDGLKYLDKEDEKANCLTISSFIVEALTQGKIKQLELQKKAAIIIKGACEDSTEKFMNVIHSMQLSDFERKNLPGHLPIGCDVAKFMKSIKDIATILPFLSTEEFAKTCEILKKTKSLSMMIQSTEDLQMIEEALNQDQRVFFYEILVKEWAEKGIEDEECKRGLSLLKAKEQVLLCSQLFYFGNFEVLKKACIGVSEEAQQEIFSKRLEDWDIIYTLLPEGFTVTSALSDDQRNSLKIPIVFEQVLFYLLDSGQIEGTKSTKIGQTKSFKEDVMSYIKQLPHENQVAAVYKALNKETSLGKFFSAKRPGLSLFKPSHIKELDILKDKLNACASSSNAP